MTQREDIDALREQFEELSMAMFTLGQLFEEHTETIQRLNARLREVERAVPLRRPKTKPARPPSFRPRPVPPPEPGQGRHD